MAQLIALVDLNDNVISYEEKYLVHSKGLLHRAFSIIVFNRKREMLLHRRALDKYHSPGLWTNTCCSHLPVGSTMETCIHERLQNEMGFDCKLKYVLTFHYQIDFNDGIGENEIDHIYIGYFDGNPTPNYIEVCEWAWCNEDLLVDEIRRYPEKYTYWFKNLIENHLDAIKMSILDHSVQLIPK